MEAASLRDGTAGTYRIAAFPTAARAIMPSVWQSIGASPDFGVELRLMEMEPSHSIAALAAGEIELAVAHSYSNMPPIEGPGLIVKQIATETVRLAVNDNDWTGSGGGRVNLSDFATHDWIVPSREWTCYDMVHRACDLAGFEPRAIAEATDFRVQLALVAAGVGVALIPELGAIDPPGGVSLLELESPIYRHIVLVSRRAPAADAGLVRIQEFIAAKAEAALVDPGA
jgi:DNA-binding transcriptional LysR family regulator